MDANNQKTHLSPIVEFAIWLLTGLLAAFFLLGAVASDFLQGKIIGFLLGIAMLGGGYLLIRMLRKIPIIFKAETLAPAASAVESAAPQADLVKIGVGILSMAMAAYAGYLFFLLSPIAGQILKPESELEKVTIFGASKKTDMDQFEDAGGLNSSPAWHGLYVVSLNSEYRASGDTLSALSLVVSGKAKWMSGISKWMPEAPLSTKDLRNILSGVCGVTENQWKFTDGNLSYGVVETPTRQCAYSPANGGAQTVFVSQSAPRGTTASNLPPPQSNKVASYLEFFQGSFSADCSGQSRITVKGGIVTFIQDGKSSQMNDPEINVAWYGNSQPPKGFNFAISGNDSASGRYVTLLTWDGSKGPEISDEDDTRPRLTRCQ